MKFNINSQNTLNFLVLSLFFFLPFERIPTFELAGFTVKISYLFGLLVLVLLFTRNSLLQTINESWSSRFLTFFWSLSFVSSLFFSPNLKRSLIFLGLWLFVFLLYLLLPKYLTKPGARDQIYSIIILSSCLVCLFGLYQFIGDSLGLSQSLTGLRIQYTKIVMGFPRIQSVALEPLYFANFLIVPFFLSLWRYIKSKSFFGLYFWTSFLILTNVILTISRGAFIAVSLSLILLLFYLFLNRVQGQYLKKVFAILTVLLLSLAISFLLITKLNGRQAASNFADHSVVENVQADGSAYDRIGTYKIALNQFREKPFLGNGVGSFGVLSRDTTPAGNPGLGVVNNEYLEILSETGIIGLGLFLLFLIYFLKEGWRGYREANPAKKLIITILFLSLFAIFIQYNFFSTLYIIYIWAFLALFKSEIDTPLKGVSS